MEIRESVQESVRETLKQQGDQAFQRQDYDKSIEFYTQAIQENPKNYVLYSNRSLCYIKQDKFHQALKDAESCIELNQKWYKGYYRRGCVLVGLNDFVGAKKCFDIAHTLKPGDDNIAEKLREVNQLIKSYTALSESKKEKQVKLPIVSYDPNYYFKDRFAIENKEVSQILESYSNLNSPKQNIKLLVNQDWTSKWVNMMKSVNSESILFMGSLLGLLPLCTNSQIYVKEKYSFLSKIVKDNYNINRLKIWNSLFSKKLESKTLDEKKDHYQKFTENFHLGQGPADCLVFSDWDYSFLNNGILNVLENSEFKKIYPCSAKVYAMGIQTKMKDLDELRKHQWCFYPEKFNNTEFIALTGSKEVLEFHFKNNMAKSREFKQNWKFSNTGTLDAVLFWYSLNLDGKNIVQFPYKAIQYIEPTPVNKNEVREVKISHNSTKIMFNLDTKVEPKLSIVPKWYFNMINDGRRLDAYQEALKQIDFKASLVVNCGAGVIPMMIAKLYPMSKIYGCETSKVLLQEAMRIFKLNKIKKDIQLFQATITQLQIPKVLPKKVDLIVLEGIDSGLLSEGLFAYAKLARDHLLKNKGVLMPCRAVLKGQLIELRTTEIEGFDMSNINTYRWGSKYQEIDEEFKVLSPEFDIFDINFYNTVLETTEEEIEIKINQAGILTAVMYWFDLYLTDQVKISSTETSCWKPCVYYLPEISVRSDDIFSLRAKHNGYEVKFGFNPEKITEFKQLETARLDKDWYNLELSTKAKSEKLMKEACQDPDKYRDLIKSVIKISSLPVGLDCDITSDFGKTFFRK